jgi:hypothetical protein
MVPMFHSQHITTHLSQHMVAVALQVRCYMGDNEQRWYMWYSGNSTPMEGLAGVAPAAGSIGKQGQVASASSRQHLSAVVRGNGGAAGSVGEGLLYE